MSTALVSLVPVAVLGSVGLLFAGLRGVLRDPLAALDVEDLRMISKQGRQRLRARSDPRARIGGPLGRAYRRLVGDRGAEVVLTLIERAGRPEGRTVPSFFDELGYWSLIMGLVGAVGLARGLPLWTGLFAFGFGLMAPLYQLWATGVERQQQIDQDLPDFLDVLAVVVSAGLGFQQAVDRVSRRYGGPLGEEMQIALHGMGVGGSLRDALRGVRERTRSDSVDQFVTALIQSDELGSPLAQSLNQIAVDVRRDASELAKRRAAKAAPKATVITIAFFVPPTMAIMVYGMMVALRG